ncbi:hypothetical protein BpHYR1_047924 [Brachionus plicatilis]|uniref:Uncharacterized protein n=1 Tax=Brachionus plicatilis TaxID=10195 RepID=A0A3M7RKX8_BRAPC|nr:hypothetical protein BpHYR1_047924 [Brachionus plicatilis]
MIDPCPHHGCQNQRIIFLVQNVVAVICFINQSLIFQNYFHQFRRIFNSAISFKENEESGLEWCLIFKNLNKITFKIIFYSWATYSHFSGLLKIIILIFPNDLSKLKKLPLECV